ncbi:hypothetical protein FIBSPDRAFT_849605 [Athelia psychrophila]|uniref:Uncharacterized protein n=1 Tax=Athelia psychrophila TaxID=1759441 RepID=A0A166UFD8_9AGAM|nr:hypothetical protein FIBSPDRAFT_849605 [Fibularhizoctonia sp. CBS 109695]
MALYTLYESDIESIYAPHPKKLEKRSNSVDSNVSTSSWTSTSSNSSRLNGGVKRLSARWSGIFQGTGSKRSSSQSMGPPPALRRGSSTPSNTPVSQRSTIANITPVYLMDLANFDYDCFCAPPRKGSWRAG